MKEVHNEPYLKLWLPSATPLEHALRDINLAQFGADRPLANLWLFLTRI